MDYEKKLELAKEALESGSYDRETIEYIFPELKETEDEKIRKWIKKELENIYVEDGIVNNILADKAFAWLEKQKPVELSDDDEIMIKQLTEYFTTGKGLQNTKSTIIEWLGDLKGKLSRIKINDAWIEDYWKHNKVNNPYSYNKGDEIQFDYNGFKRFCINIYNYDDKTVN